MFYTVYKTTNLLNGKFYIGKHKTKDLSDGYIGSGKRLKYAIAKYGIDNFSVEYLGIFDAEWKMNVAEKIYVVLDTEVSYNLCPGGHGGFGYLNSTGLNKSEMQKNSARKVIVENSKNIPKESKRIGGMKSYNTRKQNGTEASFKGMKHAIEARMKIGAANSKHQQGSKNSQFGTCWITNGSETKKIKKEELDNYVLLGYYKGRK